MRTALKSACLLLTLAALVQPLQAQTVPDEVLALHWHPATADRARNRTMAAAVWLARDGEPSDWQQTVDALALRFDQALAPAGPVRVSLADGLLPWLIRPREGDPGAPESDFPAPDLGAAGELLDRTQATGELARMQVVAAYHSPRIWREVAASLGEHGTASVTAFWSDLSDDALKPGQNDAGENMVEYAREQARLLRRLSLADSAPARASLRDTMLHAQARQAWEVGQPLDAVWLTFEALARLTQFEAALKERSHIWLQWLVQVAEEQNSALRQVDIDLPVVLALLTDAASYLAAADDRTALPALDELGDAYARLALFVPDLAFYLDQPVRESVRRTIADCRPDPVLVGPLPRDRFTRCVSNLADVMANQLDSEELIGGGQGPFAAEFLRRELGLMSWQRAAYLDGHLNWLLSAQCPTPDWANALEWSLLADQLVRWVSQRPVFFSGSGWRNTIDPLVGQMQSQTAGLIEWLDCLTGRGERRRDPVERLLARHVTALGEVAELLGQARAAFYASHTRPGADIELDGPADQVTAYRPQELFIGPCPEANTCGARVQLPVSRALLGQFPNSYLLADQIGMGELALCYDRVRWVERTMEPARKQASGVANYHGRLSLDLVGAFRGLEKADTVFRYRLTDSEVRHYLFAARDEATLAQDCPIDQVGRSVASSLARGHTGLVPNRLTYFVSTPTTPEAQIQANWDRGAEWRDWFVTGRGVEHIEVADPAEMRVAVQARLASLVAQRERQLLAPLINPPRAGDENPLVQAMARAADSAALLRRVLELHYPRVIRQHAPVRALLAGESGLMTRDRVRLMRDAGVVASRMPQLGLARAQALHSAWLALPEALRERGQRAPEIDYSLERLAELQRRMAR